MLYGAAALSVGLLASSLSSNQIVSAVVGTAALLTLSFLDAVAQLVSGIAREVLNGLSMDAHLVDFNRGVVDTSQHRLLPEHRGGLPVRDREAGRDTQVELVGRED